MAIGIQRKTSAAKYDYKDRPSPKPESGDPNTWNKDVHFQRDSAYKPDYAPEYQALFNEVLPVTTSIMVVLPAPFGPMTARISPASIANDNSSSAKKPSNETETPSR